MGILVRKPSLLVVSFILFIAHIAFGANDKVIWMKLRAKDKFERTAIFNTGVSIENITSTDVIALGREDQAEKLKQLGLLDVSFETQNTFDFPEKDSVYHNYSELEQQLQAWAKDNADILKVEVIGQSLEKRNMYNVRLSTDLEHSSDKPAVVFMGGHHAREHLSVEMPIMLINHLVAQYRAGDKDIVRFFQTREINVIPMVNPDGLEFDIADGRYKYWRKNRSRNTGGSYGTDLNRNYSYQWGTGGSSKDPRDDTFMGLSPFSEPETQVIKNFVESHKNITTLLTFHTFSQLVLYPWGHTYNSIAVDRDKKVFQTMAQTMSSWNGYTPQQSSELYIASGDTTDWAYGEHKIFAFTFELDPASMWDGGFYPGAGVIDGVFQKNIKPCLYMIEYTDNPYRVIDEKSQFGVNLSWF